MSIEVTTRADQHQQQVSEPDVEPAAVYDERLVERSDICTGCFRRHDRQELGYLPVDYAEKSDTWELTCEPEASDLYVLCAKRVATEGVETCYPPQIRDPENRLAVPAPLKRSNPRPETYCVACGTIDDDGSRPTLALDGLLAMAARIAKRLEEQDLDYDESVLTTAIERCKRVPALAGKDDTILSHAVRMATEHARTGEHQLVKTVEGQEGVVLAFAEDENDDGDDTEADDSDDTDDEPEPITTTDSTTIIHQE